MRQPRLLSYPLKITEIAAQLEGTAYVTRQSVQSVPAIRKAKKAIRKAFENSMNGKGSNLVEIVSTCSSGWKMTPEKANKWMEEHMFPFYPLGDLKDKDGQWKEWRFTLDDGRVDNFGFTALYDAKGKARGSIQVRQRSDTFNIKIIDYHKKDK